ncbi:hypothetical protein [Vulcanisaeta sp. JCM 14467]|uniref:hypothetical protein n=1 Tax=Vulcanisaeta sp. JCM 14467 TaxID=1295370 RepID=UPI0006D1D2A2|nr:hypothetical protein [Vulcanisaeta sp. JCM 14467]
MALIIRELGKEPAINLVRLIIAHYMKRYGRGIRAEVLVKLLFFTLYTDLDGTKLLETPRVRLPEEFRIYLKGPFIPIDRLLGGETEMGMYGIVKTGDSYYVKGVNKTLEEARRALEERGLKDLVDYALKIVDAYGGLSEDELIRRSLKVLGLEDEVIKAMAFNMSLDAYIDAITRLRKIVESGEFIDETELYPDLFKSSE